MNPVQHHLTNKLEWMSRQLRLMNKAETILTWTSAMNAVHLLLVEVIAKQNLWERTNRTQRRSSVTSSSGKRTNANGRKSSPMNWRRPWNQRTHENNIPATVSTNIVKSKSIKPCPRKVERKDNRFHHESGRVKVDRKDVMSREEEPADDAILEIVIVNEQKVEPNTTENEAVETLSDESGLDLMKGDPDSIMEEDVLRSGQVGDGREVKRRRTGSISQPLRSKSANIGDHNNSDADRSLENELILPPKLWSYLFMENDGWATDILKDPSILLRDTGDGLRSN